MNILQKQKEAIEKLCANHHVRKLCAFGSDLTANFNGSSDKVNSLFMDKNVF